MLKEQLSDDNNGKIDYSDKTVTPRGFVKKQKPGGFVKVLFRPTFYPLYRAEGTVERR